MSCLERLPFQYLPAIIIQQIVLYTCRISRSDKWLLNDRDDVGVTAQKSSLALSHTCRMWRTVILGLMYHRCEMYTDSGYYLIKSNSVAMHSEFFNSVPCPQGIAHVRDLFIVVNIDGISNGNTVEFMKSTNMGELQFVSATKLTIVINPMPYVTSDVRVTVDQAKEFVKYICHIAPNPVTVDLNIIANFRPAHGGDGSGFLNYLAQSLFTRTRVMGWTLGRDYFIPPDTVHAVPNYLTSICCHLVGECESLYRLIRINALALEILTVKLVSEDKITQQLVIDEAGVPVKYPYLHYLSFNRNRVKDVQTRWSLPDIAPFPRLHTLVIFGMYPFGDDIAFRENSDTLKVFKCEFDYEFVEMINELVYRKKFKGLSSLECLEVNKVNTGEEEITQKCAEAMYRFVRQFGSNKVRKLRIDYSGVANLVMKQIWADAKEKDDGWRNSIRDLSVAGVDLKYTQVLDLLKALPNLERLTSGIIENDPLEEEELLEDTSSLLDSIHKEYWLMFPKFRLWVMNSEKIENVEHCAIYSMLIGVACSGFHGIHITRAHVMEYRETLKILTAMYPYKKYPWLSKRLLPGINWRRTAKK